MLLVLSVLAAVASAVCKDDAQDMDEFKNSPYKNCEELLIKYDGQCRYDLGLGSQGAASPYCKQGMGINCKGDEQVFPALSHISDFCRKSCMLCGQPTHAPTLMHECECTGDNSLIPVNSTFFGSDYGKFCKAWDLEYPYCDPEDKTYNGGNEGPDAEPKDQWCAQQWCYVKEGCSVEGKVTAHQTVVFYDQEGNYVDLFYSYNVCAPYDDSHINWEGIDFEECKPRLDPIDVFFVIDGSSSISDEFWGNQKYFLSQLLKHGLSNEGDRVGMVQFSGFGKQPIVEYEFDDTVEFQIEDVYNMKQMKGGTGTDQALDVGIKTFNKQPQIEGRKKLMVLLTDGVPNPPNRNPCQVGNSFNIQQQAEDAEIEIVILAVGMAEEDAALLACLVDNPEINIVRMDDFESFFQYRDPTGDENLICVDPDELRNPPTNSPTAPPPSHNPTHEPTTAEPTNEPTENPTNAPTHAPTQEPTNEPTEMPTNEPSRSPSKSPTMMPTDVCECLVIGGEGDNGSINGTYTLMDEEKAGHYQWSDKNRKLYWVKRGVFKDSWVIEIEGSSVKYVNDDGGSKPKDGTDWIKVDGDNFNQGDTVIEGVEVMCQTECGETHMPTSMPSMAPTPKPTMKPSETPSTVPTTMPSPKPTKRPTRRPSSDPTVQPSMAPSRTPTDKPSGLPSMPPTELPSMPPSRTPTHKPTEKPSGLPSMPPTSMPSPKPTMKPSKKPTKKPTPMPSKEPTGEPTMVPTAVPTLEEKCPHYDKPRDKILPCDDNGKSPCENNKEEMIKKCGRHDDKKSCKKIKGCYWAKQECHADCEDVICDPCYNKASPPVVKANIPWGGTQSPDYWYNCISRWCSKYTWMGGIEQCHYEPEYGCGCEAMDVDECISDPECCYDEENGCQEKVECPRLTFEQCLEHSDKCSPCGNGGCSYNCQMGPGQELSGFQNLILDCDCQCKVTQMF